MHWHKPSKGDEDSRDEGEREFHGDVNECRYYMIYKKILTKKSIFLLKKL